MGTLSPAPPREIALLKIVVVVAGAVLMALEILGSRVLAPRYGSSVYVWGSLISTFLVALSVGYALGGRFADRRPSLAALSVVLSLAAVLMLPSVVWPEKILDWIAKFEWDVRWSALAAAIVLFLPGFAGDGNGHAVRGSDRHTPDGGRGDRLGRLLGPLDGGLDRRNARRDVPPHSGVSRRNAPDRPRGDAARLRRGPGARPSQRGRRASSRRPRWRRRSPGASRRPPSAERRSSCGRTRPTTTSS